MAARLERLARAFAPELMLVIGGFHAPVAILERLRALASHAPLVGWVGDAFDDDADAGRAAALYDLVADPGAGHNLAQTSKATLAALAAQLEAFDSHFGDLRGKSATEGLSSSEMQKLASLGYVGLQKTASASNAAVTGTDPKDEIATANRVLNALASISEGKPDRAIAVLEQAVAAAPNMYLAQYALGAALAEKQRYAQAIEHLHKAIELRPGSAWAQYEMGASLVKTGDFKTAAAHLELALVRLPEFREAHLLLAQCYEHLGQTKQAQVEKQKATR